MPRGRTWEDHKLQRDRETEVHYKPSDLGPLCALCNQRMVTDVFLRDRTRFHPCCDPRAPAVFRLMMNA